MKTVTYRAEDFVPVMACPSQVDKIRDVSELEGTEIDQVFIGSCTNGRLEDLQAAAEVLKDKKVADFVKLIVTPASRKIYRPGSGNGHYGYSGRGWCYYYASWMWTVLWTYRRYPYRW